MLGLVGPVVAAHSAERSSQSHVTPPPLKLQLPLSLHGVSVNKATLPQLDRMGSRHGQAADQERDERGLPWAHEEADGAERAGTPSVWSCNHKGSFLDSSAVSIFVVILVELTNTETAVVNPPRALLSF